MAYFNTRTNVVFKSTGDSPYSIKPEETQTLFGYWGAADFIYQLPEAVPGMELGFLCTGYKTQLSSGYSMRNALILKVADGDMLRIGRGGVVGTSTAGRGQIELQKPGLMLYIRCYEDNVWTTTFKFEGEQSIRGRSYGKLPDFSLIGCDEWESVDGYIDTDGPGAVDITERMFCLMGRDDNSTSYHRSVVMYNDVTAAWAFQQNVTVYRIFHNAFTLQGTIIYGGGHINGGVNYSNSWEKAWGTAITNRTLGVAFSSSFAANEYGYTLGGRNASTWQNSNYRYHYALNSWALVGSPINCSLAQNSVVGGYPFVCGGYSGSAFTQVNYRYNDFANSWIVSQTHPTYPGGQTGFNSREINDYGFTIGGNSTTGAYAFDHVSESWSATTVPDAYTKYRARAMNYRGYMYYWAPAATGGTATSLCKRYN